MFEQKGAGTLKSLRTLAKVATPLPEPESAREQERAAQKQAAPADNEKHWQERLVRRIGGELWQSGLTEWVKEITDNLVSKGG